MRWLLMGMLFGCGGGYKYTSTTTRGVACADAAEILCARVIECGIVPPSGRVDCENGFVRGCCSNAGACGAFVVSPDGAAECNNRTSKEPCATFGTASMPTIPAYCRGMF